MSTNLRSVGCNISHNATPVALAFLHLPFMATLLWPTTHTSCDQCHLHPPCNNAIETCCLHSNHRAPIVTPISPSSRSHPHRHTPAHIITPTPASPSSLPHSHCHAYVRSLCLRPHLILPSSALLHLCPRLHLQPHHCVRTPIVAPTPRSSHPYPHRHTCTCVITHIAIVCPHPHCHTPAHIVASGPASLCPHHHCCTHVAIIGPCSRHCVHIHISSHPRLHRHTPTRTWTTLSCPHPHCHACPPIVAPTLPLSRLHFHHHTHTSIALPLSRPHSHRGTGFCFILFYFIWVGVSLLIPSCQFRSPFLFTYSTSTQLNVIYCF